MEEPAERHQNGMEGEEMNMEVIGEEGIGADHGGNDNQLPPDPAQQLDGEELQQLVRHPPPKITPQLFAMQALRLLTNKPKKRDEYKITCRLRSMSSIQKGEEGFVVEHALGPFNENDKAFDMSRLKDLQNRAKANSLRMITEFEEIAQPMPLNFVVLLQISSEHLEMEPKTTLEIATKLHEKKYITNPNTYSTTYPSGFPTEDYVKNVIKQLEEICGSEARIDTKTMLANFTRPVDQTKKMGTGNGIQQQQEGPIMPSILSPPELEGSKRSLEGKERDLYKLICEYFLATCHKPAIYTKLIFDFKIGSEQFKYEGKTMTDPGFTKLLPWKKAVTQMSEELKKDITRRRVYKVSDVGKQSMDLSQPAGVMEWEFIGLLGEDNALRPQILSILETLKNSKLIQIVGPGRRIIRTHYGLEYSEKNQQMIGSGGETKQVGNCGGINSATEEPQRKGTKNMHTQSAGTQSQRVERRSFEHSSDSSTPPPIKRVRFNSRTQHGTKDIRSRCKSLNPQLFDDRERHNDRVDNRSFRHLTRWSPLPERRHRRHRSRSSSSPDEYDRRNYERRARRRHQTQRSDQFRATNECPNRNIPYRRSNQSATDGRKWVWQPTANSDKVPNIAPSSSSRPQAQFTRQNVNHDKYHNFPTSSPPQMWQLTPTRNGDRQPLRNANFGNWQTHDAPRNGAPLTVPRMAVDGPAKHFMRINFGNNNSSNYAEGTSNWNAAPTSIQPNAKPPLQRVSTSFVGNQSGTWKPANQYVPSTSNRSMVMPKKNFMPNTYQSNCARLQPQRAVKRDVTYFPR